jgi:diguanylate cyclase (GGDEF)-like protein/PAS domain S-box-containing protein
MPDRLSSHVKPLILIVDDDQFMLHTFQNVLEPAGFLTAVAADGTSAIAAYQDRQPDLVLLDLIMPGKDGFATCRDILNLPGGKYTPILMVTSQEDTGTIHRAFEAGATDFIAKPINAELLVYRIRYMLRASRSMKKLAKSEDRLRLLKEAVDCLPIGITISDIHGKVIYSNPTEAEMHGYTIEELIGKEARELAPQGLRKKFVPEKLNNIGLWRRESINVRKNGEEFPVQLSSIAVRSGGEGRYLGIVTACEDISSRKEAEQKIRHLAYYDTLTGLPNRGTFLDRLNRALALAHRENRRVALLFLDLDNFKDVNDTQGHDFGDKLLSEAARRLAGCMRESDTLARLGGDEFVVVLTSVNNQESAASAAQRILSVFSRPFSLEGRQIHSSASIGIALYPDDGVDADSLYKAADTAMYHAKAEGKANFRFFSNDMNQQIMRRVALENSLRLGLENREFFLHYQPLWNLQTAGMVGAEVLLRWKSADFGLMPPSEFISLAENSGLILGMGEWVLRTACTQARMWELAGHRGMKVAVNISGLQFRQPDFLETIGRIIKETDAAPTSLEFEFTESVIMEHADRAINTLRALKKMGLQLSIDDFGTGYSSLSYLKHFPIDRIKIDRSFVADVATNQDDAAIVKAIISLAHSLNLKVVAEGVESSDQLSFLAATNCNEAQGFYLGVPMQAEELSARLRDVRQGSDARHPAVARLTAAS